MNRKSIFFNELATYAQNKILDSFGASCAAELGLDTNPYAEVVYDESGALERIELFEPAV